MLTPMQIYEKIEWLSQKNGVTDRQLEKETGLKRGALGNMKKGSMPSVDKIVMIAKYFGVSVDSIIGETREEKNETEQIIEEIKKAASGDDARSRVIDLVSRLNQSQSYLVLAYVEGLLAQLPPESIQAAPDGQ